VILHLVSRSLRNRGLTTALTVASIAFSVALLVGIENTRAGMRESFAGTIQLLLYSVFGPGSPVGNISFESFERLSEHPAVAWTVPLSLGDSHRGFRVIGTTDAFYEHYRFRGDRTIAFATGRPPAAAHEVVVGSEVANRLDYGLSRRIVLSHGIGQITSILLGTHTRTDALRLQREVDTSEGEPLMAMLPGVALAEMWRTVGYAEGGLRLVTLFVWSSGCWGCWSRSTRR
jgi:hypothetical protein